MNYWTKKKALIEHAKQHTEEMKRLYAKEIAHSVEATKFYSDKSEMVYKENGHPNMEVLALDSVSAVFEVATKNPDAKRCVLNFASYKNPGGMFLEGSSAQEESLCHESTLFNVLSSGRLGAGYKANRKELNRALYLDHAFYSPDIMFCRNTSSALCDVITCAAPNYTAAKKYCNVSQEENERVLRDRILFILKVMATEGVKIPILGAFGCGVFGQDPEMVANIFKELLMKYQWPFQSVVFAIIPSDTKTLEVFQRVMQ